MIYHTSRSNGKQFYLLSKLEEAMKKGEPLIIVRTKHRTTNDKLSRTLLTEGKIIKRDFQEKYTIVEAFGQRYRIENPGEKGVKITQLPRG